ncbi:unnamed protein product [Chondrus crispus]|uniref:Uncharacterized protein n=1 Tax=Chondrus crispus TaxID=2769 RepID=R7QLZ1_CHOCR|nr:unnamed protein product [Chondrus crispus]CDF38476.1 unnamed protein product [Chondrus crispus]|eukprot:XP_005718369.1 unnamed protein product [Chondrus crispus]
MRGWAGGGSRSDVACVGCVQLVSFCGSGAAPRRQNKTNGTSPTACPPTACPPTACPPTACPPTACPLTSHSLPSHSLPQRSRL